MKRLPEESTAMPEGAYNWALMAGPLSPLKPGVPVPAMVAITPPETRRIRLLALSAMKRLPEESTAMPEGAYNWAVMAGRLTTRQPGVPVHAMVAITPPAPRRIRLLALSAMKRLPEESTAMPEGAYNWALV